MAVPELSYEQLVIAHASARAQADRLEAEVERLLDREADLCRRLYDERRETLRLRGALADDHG